MKNNKVHIAECIKKSIFFILILVNSIAFGQNVGITFNPQKYGVGLMYEKELNNDFSLILSAEHGKYVRTYNLTKIGGGFRYKLVSALILHNYSNNTFVHKTSIELGFIDDFTPRLKFLMLYDVINYEPRFGFIIKI